MKGGFFNTSERNGRSESGNSESGKSNRNEGSSSHTPSLIVPSKESLKGMKKGALKGLVTETVEHANMHISELYDENERLKRELKKLESRAENASRDADKANRQIADIKTKASELVKRSIYFDNLDVVLAISEFCEQAGYQLSFDSRAIIVTFGTLDGASSAPSAPGKYGVWIRDTGSDHVFEIRPYFAESHTHLKDVPCGGRRVVGNDSVIATLKDFASRKGEFVSGVHSSFSSMVSSLSEFLNAMYRDDNRSDGNKSGNKSDDNKSDDE